jgi:hypothetical protein
VARTWMASIVAAALAVAACGEDAGTGPGEPTQASPPGLYMVGKSLHGLPGRGRVDLAAAPVVPLAGWLTPAAVPSAGLRYVAYNTWHELRPDDPALSWDDQGIEPGDPLATPSLRLYDSQTGVDTLLEEGAFSLAWRVDGALAYFKGMERDYRAGVPYVGDIVVRPSLAAVPEVWTRERGRYLVVAWAGRRLVAYREREGEALDLLVLDGPGEVRVVAENSALVAIAPDGRKLFVEQGPAQGRPTVRIVDVGDGRETARLDLASVDPAVGAVSYAGDWAGDLVVASSTTGLAVFRVSEGGIALEQALRVGAGAEAGVIEPRFTDALGYRISAWTSTSEGGVFLDCDRAAARCEQTVPLPRAKGIGRFPVWRRPAYNPSRPLAGAS